MIYPVRILDVKGRLKKEISSETLRRRHWRLFALTDTSFKLGGTRGGSRLQRLLDYEPEANFGSI